MRGAVRSPHQELEEVLAITGTILHLTDDTYQFWMQAMDTQIDGRALTCLNNLVFKLFLHLGLRRLRYINDKRQSTVASGEHIHNETCLTILK